MAEPRKVRKYFSELKRDPESFPFIEVLEDLKKDEWERSHKRPGLSNKFAKLYPSLMRFARHVTLPIKDAVTFWDALDRKIDLELKKAYSTAGGTYRLAITTAAVAKAISAWAANVEKSILDRANQEKILKTKKNG